MNQKPSIFHSHDIKYDTKDDQQHTKLSDKFQRPKSSFVIGKFISFLKIERRDTMDQNVATIITTAITAVSTLLAATLGGFLTSYQARKSDKDKAKEEQAKQKKQLIEEIYASLITVDNKCDMLLHDIKLNINIKYTDRITEIKNSYTRIRVLVGLYTPEYRLELEKYVVRIETYLESIEDLYFNSNNDSNDFLSFYRHEAEAEETKYKKALREMQIRIETLSDNTHHIQPIKTTKKVLTTIHQQFGSKLSLHANSDTNSDTKGDQ